MAKAKTKVVATKRLRAFRLEDALYERMRQTGNIARFVASALSAALALGWKVTLDGSVIDARGQTVWTPGQDEQGELSL